MFTKQKYKHRDSTNGDKAAINLFDDLYDYCKAAGAGGNFVARADTGAIVVNKANKVAGQTIGQVRVRRGDAILGQAVPGQKAVPRPGAPISAGPLASLQIAIEVKIVATAMGKQFDRVIGDIIKQGAIFRKMHPDALTIAIVGVNHSPQYRSYEGERFYDSNPSLEASSIVKSIATELSPTSFDEVIILPYKATNVPPYDFGWVNANKTDINYNGALVRLANRYQLRFP